MELVEEVRMEETSAASLPPTFVRTAAHQQLIEVMQQASASVSRTAEDVYVFRGAGGEWVYMPEAPTEGMYLHLRADGSTILERATRHAFTGSDPWELPL